MPKITVDGQAIETREGIPVLQAALEAGWDVPHYCYHPGLSIVALCRLCLMQIMQMPASGHRGCPYAGVGSVTLAVGTAF